MSWDRTAVMGIVNVTPDSFSDGGRYDHPQRAIAHGRALIDAGAMVIDIGGESTRPGAAPVSIDDEIDRVRPVVADLVDAGCLVSIDTRHAEVADAALAAGAHLVNDVSGLRDRHMVDVCVARGVPAVVMHMLGEPATMQHDPQYDDVVSEVTTWLAASAQRALDAGVPSVMVDPGLGFGKTTEHNVALLRALPFALGHPVLVGASRKRFLERMGAPAAAPERDPATIAVHLLAAQRGAAMVRAHDVAGHVQALAVDRMVRSGG